jgi:hypothetical protein
MENIPEIRKIELENDTLNDLNITRKWSLFMTILGFIALGLILIIGLIATLFLSVFKTGTIPNAVNWGFLPAAIILVLSVVYFFPLFYLYRFSIQMGHAVRNLDNSEIKKAFKNLKRYYVYIGILLIVLLVIYFVAFFAAGASLAFLKDLGTGI